jgi:hypothetical protein
MKKEIWMLIVLFVSFGVVSAEDMITVKTESDAHVKVYAWTSGGGPLLTMVEGKADEQGLYRANLYSIRGTSYVRYHIIILKDNQKIRDNRFDGMRTDNNYFVNCVLANCTISVFKEEDLVIKENFEENETTENTEERPESQTVESFSLYAFFSNSPFIDDEGEIRYEVFLWIIVIVLAFFFFILIMKRYSKKTSAVEPEEKELEVLERKIKEKEAELLRIREKKMTKQKIEQAKKKLEEEEKEIKQLKQTLPEEIEKRQKINDAKRRLAEKESEIKRLEREVSDLGKNVLVEKKISEVKQKEAKDRIDTEKTLEGNKDVDKKGMDALNFREKNKDREEIRKSAAVKGFVDNMRRTAGEEKKE